MAEELPRRPRRRRVARRPEEASREKKNPAAAGIERFFSLKGPRGEDCEKVRRPKKIVRTSRQNLLHQKVVEEKCPRIHITVIVVEKKNPTGKKTRKQKTKKQKTKKLKREKVKGSQQREGKRLAWADGDDGIKNHPTIGLAQGRHSWSGWVGFWQYHPAPRRHETAQEHSG